MSTGPVLVELRDGEAVVERTVFTSTHYFRDDDPPMGMAVYHAYVGSRHEFVYELGAWAAFGEFWDRYERASWDGRIAVYQRADSAERAR